MTSQVFTVHKIASSPPGALSKVQEITSSPHGTLCEVQEITSSPPGTLCEATARQLPETGSAWCCCLHQQLLRVDPCSGEGLVQPDHFQVLRTGSTSADPDQLAHLQNVPASFPTHHCIAMPVFC
jgi:hypothetical protein